MVGNGRGRVLCGGEGGRAGRGAVDVDQKLEEVVSSHGAGGGSYRGSAYVGRGTRGGERLTVLPSGGSRGSGDGEAYGGGGVYSGIVMEVVVVKEVVWWYKRKIPQWWLRR
ncbi:hypothetical protein YC2023_052876 [Brassica napus]